MKSAKIDISKNCDILAHTIQYGDEGELGLLSENAPTLSSSRGRYYTIPPQVSNGTWPGIEEMPRGGKVDSISMSETRSSVKAKSRA